MAITGRRREALGEAANEITELSASPPAVVAHEAMDEGYVEAVAAAALAALGTVEILVNNAGGSRPFNVNITGKSEPEGINGAFCAKAAVHAGVPRLAIRARDPCRSLR